MTLPDLTWLNELVARAMEAVTEGSPAVMVALFLVAALTEVGVPFPFVLDSVLFFIGYQTGKVPAHVLLVLVALFLGRVLGSAVIYWPARFFGGPFLNWCGRRFPSVRRNLDRIKVKLGSQTGIALAVARLTPGLLLPATVASGAIRLRYDHFVLGVLISALAADGILLVSGLVMGLGVKFLGITPSPWVFLAGLVVVIVLIWFVPRYFTKRKAPESPRNVDGPGNGPSSPGP